MSFSIIIPSKNAVNLCACIGAIRTAGETCRIIVVDDGLPDRSAIDALTIDGVTPFVFARNINIGIRAAGDDDVILLNDDALLKTELGFTKLSWQKAGYGIIAPTCTNVGNPHQMPQSKQLSDRIREEKRTLCFTCVYIPRSTINAVGLLDERFIGYGMDDDDYSLRVRNAGLKLGIYDGCLIDHGSLTSSYRGGAEAGGDFRPNMRLFIDKWKKDNWGRDKAHSEFAHLWFDDQFGFMPEGVKERVDYDPDDHSPLPGEFER